VDISIKRPCPICKTFSKSKILFYTYRKAENFNLNFLKPYWNGFFKKKIIFSYTRCTSCGLVFCPKFFNDRQLLKLYSQMPANMDLVPKVALRKTQYGYFEVLKKNSSLTGNFLEIGPDVGLFTKFCVDEGKFNNFWLFEPNKLVKQKLMQVVKNHKFKIVNEMTNFKIIPNSSIDAVAIIHVMDHLLDPVKFLKSLKVKLKKNAKILIVTHNEKSLLRWIFGWRWPAFCLQHPQIYNRTTTKYLLNEAGYSLVCQNKTVNYFELSFLLKNLFWVFGVKTKFIKNLGDIILPLKLGNILTIATPRKK
jgi:Methyltransferase domain